MTVENLEKFIPQLMFMLHIECFVHGNMDKESALNLVNLVEQKLAGYTLPLLTPHLPLNRDMRLKDGTFCDSKSYYFPNFLIIGCNYLYEATNETHKSSCALLYLQCPPQSTRSNMLLSLFVQIASEPCYNMLRTKVCF